jgi:ribose 5-phosphate isomerase A
MDRILPDAGPGAQRTTPMTQDELKAAVGAAAVAYVPPGSVVGVGTGSTVNCFIDALAAARVPLLGAVSSSEASTQRLRHHGFKVMAAGEVDHLGVYIDGADEINGAGHMIKGGGAALTREKIVADLAEQFVCIADASKRVEVLGRFPLPVEVIPMAVPQITRRFAALGGEARLRAGVLTDNGLPILDVHGLRITDALAMEADVNQWPGVVTVGIFARHRAQVCLLGTPEGVQTLRY